MTNIRATPGGKVLFQVDGQGGYDLTVIVQQGGWWRIKDPVEVFGDDMKDPKAEAWIHRSVLALATYSFDAHHRFLRTEPRADAPKVCMIPEFIGRLPINVTLDALDQDALIRILTEPRNAPVKQYQKLFAMDHVELQFEEDALRAIAVGALKRRSGARGLRTLIERVLLDTMFEIPGNSDIKKCIVTKAAIEKGERPLLIRESKARQADKPERQDMAETEKPAT